MAELYISSVELPKNSISMTFFFSFIFLLFKHKINYFMPSQCNDIIKSLHKIILLFHYHNNYRQSLNNINDYVENVFRRRHNTRTRKKQFTLAHAPLYKQLYKSPNTAQFIIKSELSRSYNLIRSPYTHDGNVYFCAYSFVVSTLLLKASKLELK